MNGDAMFTTAGIEVDGELSLMGNGQASSTATGPLGDAIDVSRTGDVELFDQAKLSGASLYINGLFNATGGVANVDGRVGVSGSGVLSVANGGSLNAGFVLNKAAASQISIGAGGSLKNLGNVYASQINVQPGGTLGGSGKFNGAVINGGMVKVGDPQTMTITGDYTQQSGGVLDIAVAGVDPADFDHLAVSGKVSLESGSVLELDFIDGYAPKLGDAYNFLAAGSIDLAASTFGSVDVTGLAPGFEYTVTPNPLDPGAYELLALNSGVPTSVPEPGAWSWMVLGAGMLGAARGGRRLAGRFRL